MPKGDTHKKKHSKKTFIKNELVLANKDAGEFYGKVVGILNGDRIKIKDIKENELQVIIRGNFFYGNKKENINFIDSDRNDYWVLIQPGITKNQYFLKHIYNEDDKHKLYERGDLTLTSNSINTIEINNNNNIIIENNNDDWLDNI